MSDEKIYGPDVYKRNKHGLLENTEYGYIHNIITKILQMEVTLH